MRKTKDSENLINFLNKSKAIKVFPKPLKLLGNMKVAKKRVAGHH